MDDGYNWLKSIIVGGEMGAVLRAQAKASIKKTALEQFVVIGMVLLLGAIDPESITQVADAAFKDVRSKALKEMASEFLFDDAEFEAVFTEVKAETMATLDKVKAGAIRSAQRKAGV